MSRKVIIISDDENSIGNLEEILTMSGHNSIAVSNALLALDTVARKEPDVILLELKMPHKNGFELAYEINRMFEAKSIPIIAMSSFFKNGYEFLFSLCGIKRYLKKPFNSLDVVSAIENAIDEDNSCF